MDAAASGVESGKNARWFSRAPADGRITATGIGWFARVPETRISVATWSRIAQEKSLYSKKADRVGIA